MSRLKLILFLAVLAMPAMGNSNVKTCTKCGGRGGFGVGGPGAITFSRCTACNGTGVVPK